MAEDTLEQPKNNKKLLIIIVAVLVLLLAAGGVVYWLLGSEETPASTPAAQSGGAAVPVDPISYVNIAQPFIFNVAGKQRDRMVQIKVQLMVRGLDNEEVARYHSPLIESTLLSTFASATVEQLRSTNGRVELRDQATADVQASLSQVVGKPVVERVLFTDFVIQ
ncbi:flagellar basal body-associated protein FliL [Vibrio mediterranei]|uniref:Flagellar protein FliL n=1 Tax=Vibrio mediterranei TaxID=689 RepID=A0ABX5DAC4_9VIBR|nr:flagellar basal body-associated protein FliL [Vibrio mediterranei]MCG9656080.1 flagellar basal body-associated protein FliL [Vibrio mediterranei]MCG9662306.1 flagellar basal body-associated protein FliL [Vibrio mediterranei]PCD88836.1 flagellar basal body-associated protein FliL [Vibrio mediterranei]PRQ66435.1 flagellar basal body-associated protein FliL [Vibrio mediterranei]PTC03440.1 flagellar basal body-associated protein FliL [Vibrio mediterranei]